MGAITTAFVQQFSSNIIQMSQQKGSKLRNAVLVKTGIVGEDWYIDQLDATTARTKTTRNADVEYSVSDYERRKLSPKCLYDAKLIDKEDKVRMLADPTSSEALSLSMAIGRGLDDLIVTAAFGTAPYGVAGGSSESFDTTNNRVASGSTGLTIAKLLDAKKILDNYDVDDDEPRFIAVTGNQLHDLLNTTEIKSADYNTVRALVQGQIDTFCGFKFIKLSTSILDTDSSDSTIRRVIAWAKNGLGLGIAAEMQNKIDVLPQKHYATQVYCSVDAGAVRVDMDKVVEIQCVES